MQDKLKDGEYKDIQDNIRICHVIITLSLLGGAERMLMRLLLAKPESTDKKMVLVLCRAGAWGEELRSAGVSVHELGMESFLDIPRVFFQLKKFISSFQPDIVQTWMYHADFLGGLAAYLSGYKNIIWGIHRTSLSISDTKSTLVIMKLCALWSRWVPKKIICVAEAGRLAHVAAGYDASRMLVIPNGFDFSKLSATTEQRNALRKDCNFSDDELIIGCLGRFHQVKGQDNFVKAAAIVARSHKKVKFLMVGKNCDVNNVKLIGWINEHNLQDYFVLLGEREDVPVCLTAMDVFCMPSRTEGFPLCLGEAMAMGLPCVATKVGDTAVLAGGTAILAPTQDEQALAQGLLKVIALTKEQRTEMGKQSKEHVIAEFSIDKVCERFNAVYQEIVTNV
ncbi:Glycosyl transferase [Candidatus Methylobacter favarea]|uniref:Glycosyl transferase n=1 Tax=Candidatus Methylobacter favarea TaxID=2707345 RepID=A0A8S0WB10_9GAMM|nr:glycosyltransferase [Candidatus Methylobacter favarea]CAA9891289.1 Glycosyl transferase [Candidatus Methylobacter favarea]